MTEHTATETSRETLQTYREIVSEVVGFVRSAEITRSFTSLSIEELVDARIARIEEPQTGDRPGLLARLAKIKNDFDSALDAIKNTSPDAFRSPDPANDVNTSDSTTSTT